MIHKPFDESRYFLYPYGYTLFVPSVDQVLLKNY